MTKIIVDAMGGDNAPEVIINGTLDALNEYPELNIILVGNLNELEPFIEQYSLNSNDRISIVHAESIVEMHESSTSSIRNKRDSSITVAMELLKKQEADALVSIGHTGAMVAAATVKLRMLEGIDRPGIAVVLPTSNNENVILMDVGATIDCDHKNLIQFAIMGEVYHKILFNNIEQPRIGLLNIGDEDMKGNTMMKSTFDILSKLPINFIGNVEGNDVFNGKSDIIVCNGFIGNVILKVMEGLTNFVTKTLKEAFTENVFNMIVGKLAKNIVSNLYSMSDIEKYGGAPLLGVNGICVKGHGKSSARAVKYTIETAIKLANKKINKSITNRINDINYY